MRNMILAFFICLLTCAYLPADSPTGCGSPSYEINAQCYPDDLQAAVNAAIANQLPLHLSAGTYTISSPLIIDYAQNRGTGFLLISDDAIINATSISDSTPAIQIECSGGNSKNPIGCFYFHQEGTLFVNANKPGYVVALGLPDFSDAHNSIKIDQLIINNGNGSSTAGGLELNYVLDSDINVVSDAAGGGAGITMNQFQFSKLSGAASATAGIGLLITNGYTFSNTIQAIDLEASKTCLEINSIHAATNTFVSPYFNCPIPLNASAGSSNILMNPAYGAAKAPTNKSLIVGIKFY